MEWSKTKTILIVLFLILNIFLFVSNLYSNTSLGLNQDYIKYATAFLKSKNIAIETKIPAYHSSSGNIVYESRTIDAERAVNFFFGHSVSSSGQTDSSDIIWSDNGKVLEVGNNLVTFKDDSPEKRVVVGDKQASELDPYFENLGISRSDYVLDIYQQEKDSTYLKFVKKYKGQFLFDVYIDFTITQAGVQSVNMVPKDAVSTVAPGDILSAYQVLILGSIPDNSVIKEIDFGYKKFQEGDLYDTPVWRIRYSDNHNNFYNAYNGEKLGN